MLQTIGLIVAVYALNATVFRFLQLNATESEKFFGLPAVVRIIVAGIMVGGTVLLLMALTLILLFPGEPDTPLPPGF